MTAVEYPVELTIAEIVTSYTNARTPTSHASSHGASGDDIITTIDGGTP